MTKQRGRIIDATISTRVPRFWVLRFAQNDGKETCRMTFWVLTFGQNDF